MPTVKLTVAPAVGKEFTDLSRGLVVAPPGNDLGSWKVKDCDNKTDCDKKRKKGITMKILGKKKSPGLSASWNGPARLFDVNFSAKKRLLRCLVFRKKETYTDCIQGHPSMTPLGRGDIRARISIDNRAPGSGRFPPILPGGKRIEAFPCDPISVTKNNGGWEFGNNAVKEETEKIILGQIKKISKENVLSSKIYGPRK